MYEQANIEIDIEIVEGNDMLVLVVEGELDLSAAPLLDESLAMAEATDASAIVVDLDRVSFMDSAGVHVLLQHSISKANRARLVLTRGSSQVRRLLEVTGVGRYLPFVYWPELADHRRATGGGDSSRA
jgi:anti-sigma B factor antagonist